MQRTVGRSTFHSHRISMKNLSVVSSKLRSGRSVELQESDSETKARQ